MRVFLLAVLVSLAPGCKLQTKVDERTKEADSDDLNFDPLGAPTGRIGAFSSDDIIAVEPLPESGRFDLWTLQQMRLVGVLPDESKGEIKQDIAWSSSDDSVVKIDEASGQLVGLKAGSATLTATFGEFTTEAPVEFTDENTDALVAPATLVAEVDGQSITLSWSEAEAPVTNYRIVYKQSDTAPEACEASDAEVVVEATEINTATTYKVEGLEAAKEYAFRLCVLQEVQGEDDFLVVRDALGPDTSATTAP